MKVITLRSQIREASAKWNEQYRHTDDERTKTIGRQLAALDAGTATPEMLAAIIGNTTWASPQTCHECGRDCRVVVEVGQVPDDESSTARVCQRCLFAAIKLARATIRAEESK